MLIYGAFKIILIAEDLKIGVYILIGYKQKYSTFFHGTLCMIYRLGPCFRYNR